MKTWVRTSVVVLGIMVLILAGWSPPVHANTINLLNNPSFESGTDPGVSTLLSNGDQTSITDWVVAGSNGVSYLGTYWNAYDGDRSIILNANSSISQTVITAPGQTYTVVFYTTGQPTSTFPPNPEPFIKVTAIGNGLLGTSTVSLDGSGYINYLNNTNPSPPPYNNAYWWEQTFTFTANSASTVLSFSSSSGMAGLDDISMVPLPASVLLLGSGLLGLGAIGWRRKRS